MNMRLKSEKDIEIMVEGGKRHGDIMRMLESFVRPGISTKMIEDEALRLITEGGDKSALLGYKPRGAKRDFPANTCISVNEEIVHGIPNEKERILEEGDIVSIDLGLLHKGLITDSAITVAVGKIDKDSQDLIEATRHALNAGIEEAKPGKTVGDIGYAISESVKHSGFSVVHDLCGHGVGFAVHEDPFVPNFGERGEGEVLVPGLVIAIEPMLALGKGDIKLLSDGYTIRTQDGSRSAHFEHTVAITEKGNIILTS